MTINCRLNCHFISVKQISCQTNYSQHLVAKTRNHAFALSSTETDVIIDNQSLWGNFSNHYDCHQQRFGVDDAVVSQTF